LFVIGEFFWVNGVESAHASSLLCNAYHFGASVCIIHSNVFDIFHLLFHVCMYCSIKNSIFHFCASEEALFDFRWCHPGVHHRDGRPNLSDQLQASHALQNLQC